MSHGPASRGTGDGLGLSPRRQRSNPRVPVVAGLFTVAAILGGLLVAATGAGGTERYTTAEASLEAVEATLTEVATIEAVSRSTVSFVVGGTVTSVEVEQGDEVEPGTVLASLDTTELEYALAEATAAEADAELALQRALDGEVVGAGSAAGGSGSGSFAESTTVLSGSLSHAALAASAALSGAATAEPAGADHELAAAQQEVLDAQSDADAALRLADEALTSATAVCAAGTAVSEEVDSETGDAEGGDTSCRTALAEALEAQRAVATAQQRVQEAASALDALIAQRLEELQSGGTPATDDPGTAEVAGQPGTADSGSAGSSSQGGSSEPEVASGADREAEGVAGAPVVSASSEELIALQKELDAAQLEVIVATQALQRAEIVSPIAGTVVSVGMEVGDTVEAGSDTANIVVDGPGGFEAVALVAVDDLPDVSVGQPAEVLPDASPEPLVGTIVEVGLSPSSDGNGTSYPVTVALEGDTSGLLTGGTASIVIATESTEEAVAVPTSAVGRDGEAYTVTTLDGDETQVVEVEVGVVASTYTSVTEGLEPGEVVVLADRDEPLPGSATDGSSAVATDGGGRFAEGGPPGGFGPR
ncbi:MAG: biotin/lipoyl-binding protein [Microthrixaceae bacterium]|nr:biotin/lipoyl-binding protein [Microthrixaceae bacterium]